MCLFRFRENPGRVPAPRPFTYARNQSPEGRPAPRSGSHRTPKNPIGNFEAPLFAIGISFQASLKGQGEVLFCEMANRGLSLFLETCFLEG